MSTKEKIQAMRAGKQIITNDKEIDDMLKIDEKLYSTLLSKINPNRIGLLDKYVAWIGKSRIIQS